MRLQLSGPRYQLQTRGASSVRLRVTTTRLRAHEAVVAPLSRAHDVTPQAPIDPQRFPFTHMKNPVASDPTAIQFGNELHVFALGSDGNLQENIFVAGPNLWVPMQLTGPGGVVPQAPKAASGTWPNIFAGQLHACYRDVNNRIQDLVRIGAIWTVLPVTGVGGAANAPAAVGTPVGIPFGNSFHCFFRDTAGNIWDAFAVNNTWSLMQLTGAAGSAKGGAPAAGDVSVVVLDQQTHLFYRGTDNRLWDVWTIVGSGWSATKICDEVLAGDPKALPGKPLNPEPIGNYYGPIVIFRTPTGQIRGLLYKGKNHWSPNWGKMDYHGDDAGAWEGMTLNDSGKTLAPLAAGDPVFTIALESYYFACYRDAAGNLAMVAAHSYTTGDGLTGGQQFINFLVASYNVINNSSISAPFKGRAPQNITDYCSVTGLGPTGLVKMPAAVGTPCVLPVGVNDVHLFYRDTANVIHQIVSHFSGGSATAVAGTV